MFRSEEGIKEHRLKAQKMMRDKVESYAVPTMVRVVPPLV
jgi:hypothetical protein